MNFTTPLDQLPTMFAEYSILIEDAMKAATPPDITWAALLGLRQGSLSLAKYANRFLQLAKSADATSSLRPTLFRQGLSPQTQKLLVTVPPATTLEQEISAVTNILQRQKILAIAPLQNGNTVSHLSSAAHTNPARPVELFLLPLTIRHKNESGELVFRRVKALIDTGSEKNYLAASIASKLHLSLGPSHPVQLACAGPLLHSKRLVSPLTFGSGTAHFSSPFFALKNLSFQMILGLEWWQKYSPNIDPKTGMVTGLLSNGSPWSLSLARNTTRQAPLGSIKEVQLPAIPQEFSSFAHLFAPSKEVPTPDNADHVFSFRFLKDCMLPKGCPIYTSNLKAQEALGSYIQDMLARGLIVPSKSSVVSPVLLVPKSDGTQRPCVAFKRLSAITEPDHYPMPLMPDIIKMISGAKIFSKLDLKDAFNQVPVKKEHQRFTAFKCPKGIFEYKVMPFGLRNAPAVFQRMIDQVLGCLIGVCCVAYMDDILVFSRLKEQHTADVRKVLAALSKA